MNKKIFFCILWGIVITGCVAGPIQTSRPDPFLETPTGPLQTSQPYPFPETPTGPLYTSPLMVMWSVSGDPQISVQSYHLAIHGFMLRGQETFLLYSLSGIGLRQLIASADIQVVDDQGNVSLLIAAVPMLERPGQPEVGGMRFEHRIIGASELYLRITPKQGEGERLETMFARFERLSDDFKHLNLNDYLDRTYFAVNETTAEQGGYKISFRAWYVVSDTPDPNRPADLEATPQNPDPNSQAMPTQKTPWAAVPPGVEVFREATIRIENATDGEVTYLWLQLLSDGEELGLYNGEVIQPSPILVAPTPTPPNSYP